MLKVQREKCNSPEVPLLLHRLLPDTTSRCGAHPLRHIVGLALQVLLLQLPVDGADGAAKPHPGGRPAGAGRGKWMIPLTIRLEKALEQRAHTAHLKPALAPLYKAASAVSAGSYRRRSVASAAAAAEPRSRTGRGWHRTASTTAISGRCRWCRALQGSRALTRTCRLTAGAGSKPLKKAFGHKSDKRYRYSTSR